MHRGGPTTVVDKWGRASRRIIKRRRKSRGRSINTRTRTRIGEIVAIILYYNIFIMNRRTVTTKMIILKHNISSTERASLLLIFNKLFFTPTTSCMKNMSRAHAIQLTSVKRFAADTTHIYNKTIIVAYLFMIKIRHCTAFLVQKK